MTQHYTWVPNVVAIVTDGTAVLGLGDIGPAAAMPVMEGKAVLFKQFGGVDAVPICLDTTDIEEIIETVARLAPSFGGINLEDISAPRCFEIEARLKERCSTSRSSTTTSTAPPSSRSRRSPTLCGSPAATRHDSARVIIQGAGAAGVAVARILLEAGIKDIAVLDRQGVLNSARSDLTTVKAALARTPRTHFGRRGSLADVMAGADVYIGVSGGSVPEEIVASMAPDSIIFGLANPTPEVHPDLAHKYARIVATGRSDFPNQINNVLAFPGIFRGAFDVHATSITEGMKVAAATALAELVGDDLREDLIIPSPFDPRVPGAVREAVADAARRDGVARR